MHSRDLQRRTAPTVDQATAQAVAASDHHDHHGRHGHDCEHGHGHAPAHAPEHGGAHSHACGGGGCGSAASARGAAPTVALDPATVDGVPLHAPGQQLDAAMLRQRACLVLLQGEARRAGLIGDDEPMPIDGVASEAADRAIEALLDRELALPEADETALRRHFEARAADFRDGDAVRVRHVLFAVTPGVDVGRLRERAEATLLSLRTGAADDAPARTVRFAKAAAELSNCPSGEAGGELGWLERQDCAPEIARELFAGREVGVLSRLVHSRFGLHVFEVLERREGTTPDFETVRPAVAAALHRQAFGTALTQYLRVLAGRATLHGVDLEAANSPLVN